MMRQMRKKKPVSPGIIRSLKEFEGHFLDVLAGADARIAEPSAQAIEAGGKRLRPALVFISAGLGSGVDRDQLLAACTAVELVHLASLVHDDVLDGSNMRRGISTINANYGERRAVQIGDFLFGLAFDVLATTGDNDLARPLARASVELSSGELKQRRTLRDLDQPIDEYLEKVFAKTAALFVAACAMGARLAGLDQNSIKALTDYAAGLGTAFQIFDDILDFSGDERALGKPVGSDIREGTVTLPMIYALECDGSQVLSRAISDPEANSLESAVGFVLESGAIDRAKIKAREYVEQAKDAAGRLPRGSARSDLLSLGNFVIDRYH